MVPKWNFALMLLLSGGLLAGATLVTVSNSHKPTNGASSDVELQALINKLQSQNEESVREAERRLSEIGPAARPALEEASKSTNRELATRASRILETLDNKGTANVKP